MPQTDSPLGPALMLALVFTGALVISLMARFWLASRQMRHVARHSDAVPAAFAGTVPLESHRKAARYTLTGKSSGGRIDAKLDERNGKTIFERTYAAPGIDDNVKALIDDVDRKSVV